MKKSLVVLAVMAMGLASCGKTSDSSQASLGSTASSHTDTASVVSPESQASVEKKDDSVSGKEEVAAGATDTGKGGLNFGGVSWTDDMMKKALREYLKGKTLMDGSKSYREMYQIATVSKGVPQIASVEYYMNPETFSFYGSSESTTGKISDLKADPNCALYWTRQLRDIDASYASNYFMSYGVEVEGSAVFYDLETVNSMSAEDKADIIAQGRAYYRSMGAQYAAYYDADNANYLADDAFVQRVFGSSATSFYAVKPTKIVITSPYLIFVQYIADETNPDGYYFAVKSGNYTMKEYTFLSKSFLKELLDFTREGMHDENLVSFASVNYKTGESSGLKTQTSLKF